MAYQINKQPFAEDKLPIPYESSFRVKFNFDTKIVETKQGKEYRYPGLSEPYISGELSDLLLTKPEADTLIGFFNLWRGSYVSFRLWLPWFGKTTSQIVKHRDDPNYYIGSVGKVYFDGSKGQLFKEYIVANDTTLFSTCYKTITKPNFADFKLFDGGTEVTSGWTLNTATGELDYTPSGTVTWQGSFDIPCIFERDEMPSVLEVGETIDNSHATSLQFNSTSYFRFDSLPIKEELQTPAVNPPEKYGEMPISLYFDYYPGETQELGYDNFKYETENQRTYREFRQLQKDKIQFTNDIILDQSTTQNGRNEADAFITLFFCSRGRLQIFYQFYNTDDERKVRFNEDSLEVEPVRKLISEQEGWFPYTLKFTNIGLEWLRTVFSYGTGLVDKEVNPVAKCVLISRTDGVKQGFTSHDRDLIIEGITYRAAEAVAPSAIEKKPDLSVNNMEIESVLAPSGIKPEDIVDGRFQDAEVTIFLVDITSLPTTPSNGLVLQKGIVGEVTSDQVSYSFELVSKTDSLLNKKASKKISPLCPYVFGDSNCGVDLANHTYASTIAGANGKIVIINDAFSVNFQYGQIKVTSGLNNGYSRYILKENSDTEFVLFQPFPYVFNGGETLEITAGCQKTPAACKNYNNFSRFGGFPTEGDFMPGNDRIYHNIGE